MRLHRARKGARTTKLTPFLWFDDNLEEALAWYTSGVRGWLRDRFGLSWQIIPRRLMELLGDPDPAAAARVQDAMLAMGKIDVGVLEAARAERA